MGSVWDWPPSIAVLREFRGFKLANSLVLRAWDQILIKTPVPEGITSRMGVMNREVGRSEFPVAAIFVVPVQINIEPGLSRVPTLIGNVECSVGIDKAAAAPKRVEVTTFALLVLIKRFHRDAVALRILGMIERHRDVQRLLRMRIQRRRPEIFFLGARSQRGKQQQRKQCPCA